MTFEEPPVVRVAKGASYLFISGVIMTLAGVLFLSALTHVWADQPSSIGVYISLVFFYGLAPSLASLSLQSAATKYVPGYLMRNEKQKANALITRITQITVVTAVAIGIGYYLASNWLSIYLFKTARYTNVIQFLALSVVVFTLSSQVTGFLVGLQKLREAAIIAVTLTSLKYGLALCFVLLGLGLHGIIFGWVIGDGLSFALALIVTSKHLSWTRQSYPVKPLLSYCLPLYVTSLLGFGIFWIDSLLILTLLQKEALSQFAFYHVALSATLVLGLITGPVGTAIFPRFSQIHGKYGTEALETAFTISVRYIALVCIPASFGLAAISYPLLTLFFGKTYAEYGAVPLAIISISSILSALSVVISTTLMTLEETRAILYGTIISISTNILFCFLLVPFFAIQGAAFARAFMILTSFLYGFYVLRNKISIKFDRRAVKHSLIASVCMVLALFPVELFLSGSTFLPLYLVAGLVSYFGVLHILRTFNEADIQLLTQLVPKRFEKLTQNILVKLML